MRIGIFGGGQLGRMMALAGYPFNLRFSFYDAAQDCPSAPLGQMYGDIAASPDQFRCLYCQCRCLYLRI
jgi:5-(carboxyamino)imidazole ribonucleotide synthase